MTTRPLTPAFDAAVQDARLEPIVLFEGEFEGGTLRFWTGFGTVTWNGHAWTGFGNLVGVSAIEETLDTRAAGVRIRLSGVSASIISTVLAQARHYQPGRLWLGALDAAGAIIADPYRSFAGLLGGVSIEDSGDACTVTVTYESELALLEQSAERRYTDEDQRIDYPDDRGLEFVVGLQDKQIPWGRG
jgi:hypothetical protein